MLADCLTRLAEYINSGIVGLFVILPVALGFATLYSIIWFLCLLYARLYAPHYDTLGHERTTSSAFIIERPDYFQTKSHRASGNAATTTSLTIVEDVFAFSNPSMGRLNVSFRAARADRKPARLSQTHVRAGRARHRLGRSRRSRAEGARPFQACAWCSPRLCVASR